jgi:hypothetical protein
MPFDMLTNIPEEVKKLDADLQDLWVDWANKTETYGYSEEQCSAVAWTVIKRAQSELYSEVLFDYPAMRPGVYHASVGGKFEVDKAQVEEMTEAVNMLYGLGQPVALIDGHGSTESVGVMPAARVEDDVMRAVLVGGWWVIAGIREGTSGLSMEAIRDYKSDAYTGGKTFAYWPTAWAVLPAGEQPAIPPGEPMLAAKDRNIKPVRLYAQETAPKGGVSPKERGQDTMTIEELTKQVTDLTSKVSALEAEKTELSSKLTAAEQERDKLRTANEQREQEAAIAAAETEAETMLNRKLPGVREGAKAEIEACEGADAKRALIATLDKVLPDMTAEEQKLHAGEGKPDVGGEEKDEADRKLEAAEKLCKDENIPMAQALERVFAQ